jgi:hypothetical protein
MLWRPFAAIALVAAVFGSARAADEVTIDAFSGQWVGKVTVETVGPTDFPDTVRDAGVTITPDAAGGFSLEWSTVRRESGDRESPDETVQDSQVSFARGDRPGRWVAVDGDRDKAGTRWFARLEGATLTVAGFALLEDGQAELQTYRRTLEGDSLGLTYTRVVDGDVKRRASGALARFAQ